MKNIFLLAMIITLFCGCSHVVSRAMRDSLDKDILPQALFNDPDAHRGKIIMLGGIIASTKNTAEGTYLEVVEKELDYRGEPRDVDSSQGRFLILHAEFLDAAIYSKGREVTVVGEVLGKEVRPLGEIQQYPYPLLKSKELYLFEKKSSHRNIPIRFGIGILHTF